MTVTWDPTLASFFQHKWAHEFRTPALFSLSAHTHLGQHGAASLPLPWLSLLPKRGSEATDALFLGRPRVCGCSVTQPASLHFCVSAVLPCSGSIPHPSLISHIGSLPLFPRLCPPLLSLAGSARQCLHISLHHTRSRLRLCLCLSLFPYLSITPLVSSCSEALSLPPSASCSLCHLISFMFSSLSLPCTPQTLVRPRPPQLSHC